MEQATPFPRSILSILSQHADKKKPKAWQPEPVSRHLPPFLITKGMMTPSLGVLFPFEKPPAPHCSARQTPKKMTALLPLSIPPSGHRGLNSCGDSEGSQPPSNTSKNPPESCSISHEIPKRNTCSVLQNQNFFWLTGLRPKA
ncbi:hypothetical protein KP509_03G023900 [Ceratopteris richardii]|uniref:Uncharacterized protein n=1 Tax=Ceratopteris richardii TaxID=49495 RepID=A0A8T2UY37_CERRI|nr:hypothetical protein KP509_03G023900 [Ceratopteris richardii]